VLFEWLGYQIASGNVGFCCAMSGSVLLAQASFTIFTLKKRAVEVTDLATQHRRGPVALRALVSRERLHLDRESILSSVCESVGENTVDSIVSPFCFLPFWCSGRALLSCREHP